MHKFIKISIIAILLLTAVKLYSQVLTPEEIYEKVNDAVVVIIAYDFNNEPKNQGSGVVLNDKGYVVTNYHVFAGCERLEIKHYDKTIPYSDIIGVDVEKDLLILKIDDDIFPSIQLANVDELKIGQRVYAIGSPLGFENSMSEGIISGLRNSDIMGRNFIQITAGISPGSSGGAVVNSKGELIGISTLTFTEGQNLNFAIPINDIFSLKTGSYSDKESIEIISLFYKGFNAIESGNYSVGIKYFDEYLKKNPRDAVAYNNRGVAYNKLKKYDKAISDYTKAISIDPNYADAYHNRGNSYYHLKKYEDAIYNYTKAININPNLALSYKSRGNCYYFLKKYDKAISDHTSAISIKPDYANAYYDRGSAYYSKRDCYNAKKDWEKAIELNNSYESELRPYINRCK